VRPIRIAVVGLGYWGPNLVRALHEVEGVEVAWACDARVERLASVVRRFPAVRGSTRLDEVVDDPDVDAVVIATPVASHYRLARSALEAGKHVFVEKPLASASGEAAGLRALARERGLVLMPGHTFLYSPSVIRIGELIRSGDLGEIYFVSMSRVNLGLHQPDVSVVWDLAPHDFSILRFWLDELPSHVAALTRGCVIPGTPDVAFINLDFPSGTIAHVELSWLAPGKLRRTTVVGSQRMVLYDDTSTEPVRIFDAGVVLDEPRNFQEYRLTYRTGDIVSPHLDPSEPLVAELTDFRLAISGGHEPRSSATLGVEVVEMIEAVDRSLTDNGARVELTPSPLPQPALR
jgi:predicted dehydrogenase